MAKGAKAEEKVFVDLGSMPVKTKVATDARIRAVTVKQFGDTKTLIDMAYRGNVVVMDFSAFEDTDQAKRNMVKEFMKAAVDISGAFMEVSGSLMILAGNGMPIDKVRLARR
ncbi:MAG: cell division protein SepF [Candidatus Methanomethylophilaceae archaeon]|jgi:SepF-like predicted cell division protein (DUF552 family)